MQVMFAVAEFERDLLLKRTHASIARAKTSGKRHGCPPALNDEQKKAVFLRFNEGKSISAIAREFDITRQDRLPVWGQSIWIFKQYQPMIAAVSKKYFK